MKPDTVKKDAVAPSVLNDRLDISLLLRWNIIPESLPPDPEGGWFSPIVWLALSDGRVVPGQCLHKRETAKYDSPVHDWFVELPDGNSHQLDKGLAVIAWMPFAVPNHPHEPMVSNVKLDTPESHFTAWWTEYQTKNPSAMDTNAHHHALHGYCAAQARLGEKLLRAQMRIEELEAQVSNA